jgi:replication-associated recombination protein RarA
MGFGKAKYDVEEKGLDPKVAHKDVAQDGRLATAQPSETATKSLDAANVGLEKAVENLRALDVPVYGLDAAGEVVEEKGLTGDYSESDLEDIKYVQKLLNKDNLENDAEEAKQKYLETAEKLKDLEPKDGIFAGPASKPKATKPAPAKKK